MDTRVMWALSRRLSNRNIRSRQTIDQGNGYVIGNLRDIENTASCFEDSIG